MAWKACETTRHASGFTRIYENSYGELRTASFDSTGKPILLSWWGEDAPPAPLTEAEMAAASRGGGH